MKLHSKRWSIYGVATAAVGLTFLITSGAFSADPLQAVRDDGSSPVLDWRTPIGSVAGPAAWYDGFITGFEAPYVPGTLNLQPASADPTLNWGQLTTPGNGVSTAHPATGTQHFRMSYDPAIASGPNFDSLRLNARCMRNTEAQTLAPPQKGVWTTEFDAAMTGIASDIRIIAQDRFGPLPRMFQMVFESSTGQVYYSQGGFTSDNQLAPFDPPLVTDDSGAYHRFKIVNDACSGFNSGVNPTTTTTYFYDGVQIGSYTGQSGNEPALVPGCVADQYTQILILSNNFDGSLFDMDNLSITNVPCVATCGNGIFEPGEGCEPGVVDCNAGHTCDATSCTCDRICTLNSPCILHNGPNGLFTPPFDAAYGAIFLYDSGSIESVSLDTCGTPGDETGILYFGSAGDGVCSVTGVACGAGCPAGEVCNYDPGMAVDDCCDPVEAGYAGCTGADPTAPCYDAGDSDTTAYAACTCYDIPEVYDPLYILQIRPSGAGVVINVNKKAACGGGHVGACCDNNGAGLGCTDTVLQADCSGADKVWTENGKCADVTCVCIPNCTGRVCGDDGCAGTCGDCDDDDVCTGTESCDGNGQCIAGTPLSCGDGNACNGVETCDPTSGCQPGTPLVCDNGTFCDGTETCNPGSGCQSGSAPCTEDETCNEANDRCDPNTIPTVSEWGLVILTLLLLTGAKVYFSRRQVIA
jgi:hypothetical protein